MKVVEINGRWRIPYSEIDCRPAVEGLNKWRFTHEFHQRKGTIWRGSWTHWENRKTFGEVSVIEEGYRFRIERGQERVKEVNRISQEEANWRSSSLQGLTRFGFEYLVEFKAYGVNVVVASQDDKDYTQELMEDFVEIVKSFA